jgi:hypothetical protein
MFKLKSLKTRAIAVASIMLLAGILVGTTPVLAASTATGGHVDQDASSKNKTQVDQVRA